MVLYLSSIGSIDSVTTPNLAELALPQEEDWKRQGSPFLCLELKLELEDMERQSEVRDTNQNRKERSGQGPEQSQVSQPLLESKMLEKDCFLQSVSLLSLGYVSQRW